MQRHFARGERPLTDDEVQRLTEAAKGNRHGILRTLIRPPFGIQFGKLMPTGA
jgi:hypothetical protein